MQGARHGMDTWRGKAALGLIALALLVRVMIPAGYMPAAGQGFAITLCTGTGTVSAWMDEDGNVHKGKPADSKPDHPCTFAGFSAALDMPDLGGGMPDPPSAFAGAFAANMPAVAIGWGLAAPPPPPTGPPASL